MNFSFIYKDFYVFFIFRIRVIINSAYILLRKRKSKFYLSSRHFCLFCQNGIYMHIIIDIRDIHPFSSIVERYGESWWELWQKYHPHDTISYLIFETQIIKDSRYIQVPKWPASWWRKKKIMTHNKNEVFRCVNFSAYEPYTRHIPTLTHIFHNRAWLYPNEWENTYIARKALEYRIHRITHNSNKIIVPSMNVWLECVELWWIWEHNVEIMPYIPIMKRTSDPMTPIQFQIQEPYILYDGSFGSEWNILWMLKGFELYKHIYKWALNLVMYGAPGHELSHITQVIRAFDLTESVKLVGILEWPNYEWLYENAKAWIMVGSYYSGWPRIELAHTYWLPMILSDIASTKHYNAFRIHPNHITQELAPILLALEKWTIHSKKTHEYKESEIVDAYEIHLSEWKK